MKKNKLIILLLPTLLLSGCGSKSTETTTTNTNVSFGSSFRYLKAEEVPIDITKAGVEVTSVEVIGIPDSGIKVAEWDNAGIKLHVSYNDSTSEDFPFLVKHLPLDQRHLLGVIGHHNIEICVNGHSTKFGFNIIKNADFNGYKCQFVDTYTQGVVYETTVGYYENVAYGGSLLPDHPTGEEFITSFVGWNYPLEYVHQDMIYNSVYKDNEKRYYGDSVQEGTDQVVSTFKDTETGNYHVLAYLGRVHRIPFNYSETIYHKKGDADIELSFLPLELYNERWDTMNKNIVKYGLNYSFDNNVGQYLFGSNNAFGSSPNCLSAFESMYAKNTYHTTLDTGISYDTSAYPNYKTSYLHAESHINDKRTVTSDAETGYYRLAGVMNYDAYISFCLTKLNNGKFQLSPNSKFVFAPIVESVDVLAQFSETEEFVNNFAKKVEYSNKLFYETALGLDWGN